MDETLGWHPYGGAHNSPYRSQIQMKVILETRLQEQSSDINNKTIEFKIN